jgi:hypothetical protein
MKKVFGYHVLMKDGKENFFGYYVVRKGAKKV